MHTRESERAAQDVNDLRNLRPFFIASDYTLVSMREIHRLFLPPLWTHTPLRAIFDLAHLLSAPPCSPPAPPSSLSLNIA